MEINLLLQRAELLLAQGRNADAEQNIRQALEQQPQNDHALAMLARCFFSKKNFDEGIAVLQQAISLSPYNSFYFYLLGYAYYQKGNCPAAIEQLQQAISINPYSAEFFGLLAYVLLETKKFEAALQKANEGLALEAESITCLNARSIALNKLNRTDAAIETMQDALAQDPDNEVTHATVGWNFLEKGKHKEATKHFLEALRINPGYSNAKNGLKEALKSKVPPYKWLLQYSFWVHNKGKNMRVILPIALYILFRLLISLSANKGTEGLSLLLFGFYLLVVVTTWTISSIANFVLLFHPIGKHALNVSEKWSAITVVSAMATGLVVLALSLTPVFNGTAYSDNLFFAGLVCLSLALPLGSVHYPLTFGEKNWRASFAKILCAVGIVSLLVYIMLPVQALTLFAIYGVAFLAYNWAGVVRW